MHDRLLVFFLIFFDFFLIPHFDFLALAEQEAIKYKNEIEVVIVRPR